MEDKHIYTDEVIGISFRKPKSWFFVSKKNVQKSRKKAILAKGSKEIMEDFNMTDDEFFEMLEEPLCVMTKYDPDDENTRSQFSPTITVNVTSKSSVLGCWGNETFEDIIQFSKKNMPDILEGFKLLKEYGQSRIDDKKAYEFDTSYIFKHIDLKKPIIVEMKSIKIETDQFFIDINCHSSIQAKEVCNEEIAEFVKTIRIK